MIAPGPPGAGGRPINVVNQVLIAGASGLVGTATLDSFLADDWDAVALARRRPEVGSGKPFRHLAVDLRDEKAARAALSSRAAVRDRVTAARGCRLN